MAHFLLKQINTFGIKVFPRGNKARIMRIEVRFKTEVVGISESLSIYKN